MYIFLFSLLIIHQFLFLKLAERCQSLLRVQKLKKNLSLWDYFVLSLVLVFFICLDVQIIYISLPN
jgi:hypothetical protein